MIEPREFEIREIGKTPHEGTYHIATFFDSHTGELLPREAADAVLICEYDDNDFCIYHTKLLKKGASPVVTRPPWLNSNTDDKDEKSDFL